MFTRISIGVATRRKLPGSVSPPEEVPPTSPAPHRPAPLRRLGRSGCGHGPGSRTSDGSGMEWVHAETRWWDIVYGPSHLAEALV